MKHKINKRRQWLSTATVAALLSLGALGATCAERTLGQKYGSREPHVCKDKAAAGKRVSVAEAVESFICHSEHEIGNESLFLVENVKVTFCQAITISSARRPLASSSAGMPASV